jgi:2-dehydro-3-deoxygluconokinase
MGCNCVVATRGSAGTSALQGGRWADAASVVAAGSIVDPLGAGDAFIAGFLQATDHERPLSERLQQGSAWAAEACLHLGAWVAPSESETA